MIDNLTATQPLWNFCILVIILFFLTRCMIYVNTHLLLYFCFFSWCTITQVFFCRFDRQIYFSTELGEVARRGCMNASNPRRHIGQWWKKTRKMCSEMIVFESQQSWFVPYFHYDRLYLSLLSYKIHVFPYYRIIIKWMLLINISGVYFHASSLHYDILKNLGIVQSTN